MQIKTICVHTLFKVWDNIFQNNNYALFVLKKRCFKDTSERTTTKSGVGKKTIY